MIDYKVYATTLEHRIVNNIILYLCGNITKC